MIEPTDSEIIMYVSILQVLQDKVEDVDLRHDIVEDLGKVLIKYSKMRRGDKAVLVKKFKENVKKMEKKVDLNSPEYTIDTRG